MIAPFLTGLAIGLGTGFVAGIFMTAFALELIGPKDPPVEDVSI